MDGRSFRSQQSIEVFLKLELAFAFTFIRLFLVFYETLQVGPQLLIVFLNDLRCLNFEGVLQLSDFLRFLYSNGRGQSFTFALFGIGQGKVMLFKTVQL